MEDPVMTLENFLANHANEEEPVKRTVPELVELVQRIHVPPCAQVSISELREPCSRLLWQMLMDSRGFDRTLYVQYYTSLVLSLVVRARLQHNTEYAEQDALLSNLYETSVGLSAVGKIKAGEYIRNAVATLRELIPHYATFEIVMSVVKQTRPLSDRTQDRLADEYVFHEGGLFSACRYAIRAEYMQNVGIDGNVVSTFYSPIEDIRRGEFMRAVSEVHSPLFDPDSGIEALLDPCTGICPVLTELAELRDLHPEDSRSFPFIALVYSVPRLIKAFKHQDVSDCSFLVDGITFILKRIVDLIRKENGDDPVNLVIMPSDEHPEVRVLFSRLTQIPVWMADMDDGNELNAIIEIFRHVESRSVLNRTLIFSFDMLLSGLTGIHCIGYESEMHITHMHVGEYMIPEGHYLAYNKGYDFLEDVIRTYRGEKNRHGSLLYRLDWMTNTEDVCYHIGPDEPDDEPVKLDCRCPMCEDMNNSNFKRLQQGWTAFKTNEFVGWICGLHDVPPAFPLRSTALASANVMVEKLVAWLKQLSSSARLMPALLEVISALNEKRLIPMGQNGIAIAFSQQNGKIEADFAYEREDVLHMMCISTLSWLLPHAFRSVRLFERCTDVIRRIPKHRIEDRMDCYRRLLQSYCDFKGYPTDSMSTNRDATPGQVRAFLENRNEKQKRLAEIMFDLRRTLIVDLREVSNRRLPFAAQPPSKLLNANTPEWEVVGAVTDGHGSYRNMYKRLCSVIHGRLIKFCSDASVVETSIRVECPLPGDEVVTQFGDMVTKIVQHYLGAVYCVSSDSASASIATNLRSDYAVWTDVPEPGSNGKSKVVVGVRKPLFDPHVAAYVEARALKTRAAVALREFLE